MKSTSGELQRLVGKTGVYKVLSYLSTTEKARFKDINEATRMPCPASLSQALKELHKLGFIARKTVDVPGETPVSYYFLTPRGSELLNVINTLKELEKTEA